MATTQVEEPQSELLAAALAFLEKSGIAGQSLLVSLPGDESWASRLNSCRRPRRHRAGEGSGNVGLRALVLAADLPAEMAELGDPAGPG